MLLQAASAPEVLANLRPLLRQLPEGDPVAQEAETIANIVSEQRLNIDTSSLNDVLTHLILRVRLTTVQQPCTALHFTVSCRPALQIACRQHRQQDLTAPVDYSLSWLAQKHCSAAVCALAVQLRRSAWLSSHANMLIALLLLQELELDAPPVAATIGPLPTLAPSSQGLFDVLGSTARLVEALAGEGTAGLPAGLPMTLPGANVTLRNGRRLLQVLLYALAATHSARGPSPLTRGASCPSLQTLQSSTPAGQQQAMRVARRIACSMQLCALQA